MLLAAFEAEPEDEYKRWSKKEKKFLDVPCPPVIKKYNENMGVVDLADRMLALNPQKSRTNRWTPPTMLQMSDLACINSWLQYRADKKTFLTTLIISVAEALLLQKMSLPFQDDEDDTNFAARKRPPQDDEDDIKGEKLYHRTIFANKIHFTCQ
ncbi:hypothetical protein HPB47_009859 [Ixodes persulcatus]|uniref:Uncharacterized protein n=1 Tax=Ixodes persulcatus TaxID=34615 RepID=A0AC60P0P4_IXOPE|nr:hypothetical protein HPB47_009859 [Ixodes persulcatus]